MAYVISDEGAYRLGLVLLFGNDLYIPIYLQKLMLSLMKALTNLEKKKKKKKVISDGGIYKLGLVIQSRCGLCL